MHQVYPQQVQLRTETSVIADSSSKLSTQHPVAAKCQQTSSLRHSQLLAITDPCISIKME